MPAAPTEARVRAYNVGFGDCFLLTFGYPDHTTRHVLIDFGSTKRAQQSPKSMTEIADQIRKDCGGKLHMVVATHRHADHISGFAGESGRIIASLEPDLVVQPWTEQPDLAPDATAPAPGPAAPGSTHAARAVVARLADMHLIAELVKREAVRLASTGARKTVIEQLTFLGDENLPNRDAVQFLAQLGRQQVYAHFGSKLPVRQLLPGVKIDVLGPPTVEQYAGVAQEVRTNANEFWHLAASTARALRPGARKRIFPKEPAADHIPQEARWVIPQIDRMSAEELLSLVRILDDAMNNTSLILLFDVGGTLLLFPGDAQLENWSYALRDAPNATAIRARVAGTRFYKVGHHASLNATPKTLLWEAFEHRNESAGADGRLITLVSTLAHKHGSEARGTEVPRKPLMEELARNSELHNTQAIKSTKEFWLDVTIPI